MNGIPILGSPAAGMPGNASPGEERNEPVGELLRRPMPEDVDGEVSLIGGESSLARFGERGPDSFEHSDKIPDSSPNNNIIMLN